MLSVARRYSGLAIRRRIEIDRRQELPRGVRIALLNGGQDAGNLIHQRHTIRR
jgi:hypothetical protein